MFQPVDLKTYPRAEYYRHFRTECPCAYNVTAECDVTRLRAVLKAGGFRFYPAMIYLLGRGVNAHEEFRMAEREGVPGFFDLCHPSYTIPNALPRGFAGIWTEYDAEFSAFHAAYLRDIAEYGKSTRYAPKPGQPENTYYVSCVPELKFVSIEISLPQDSMTPVFTLGGFREREGKTLLPVSARLHHAACDGFHVSRLFGELEELANGIIF